MQAKAIWYLPVDRSADPDRDDRTIRQIAESVGYQLVDGYMPVAGTDPTAALLERIHAERVAAVVVASREHLSEDMVAAITAVCSLVTPDEILPGNVQYPGA